MYKYLGLETVLDKLAAIYVAADTDERDRITAGVESFNAQIAFDPLEVGESRESGYRLAFPPLLQTMFHVDYVNRLVRVTDVKRYGH